MLLNIAWELISTNYVTIDGSNTNGGTTKDLTILGASMSIAKSVFRIFGNNDNISIKNCTIINKVQLLEVLLELLILPITLSLLVM
jgi:hypothetical protein